MSAYEFDDVRVDPAAFRVTKAGNPVPLEPKAFEVLLVLLRNPGRLVEKKELLDRVWPDTVVTESALTRVIADLRRALGDAAREARYIETVPTRGYRFLADVRRIDDAPSAMTPVASRMGVAWVTAGAVAMGLLLLAAVLFTLRARRPRPAAATAPGSSRLTQVTDSLGLDGFPTFSPDGTQIAYCSDRDGTVEIYVRQLAPGGREIRITSDGRDNLRPAWSPDGRHVAYAARALPGIWVVPALGGEPRRLTTFGSHPAWSPDAGTIAFQSELGAGPPSSLWLVPAAGGEPVPLTRPGRPTGGHGSPVFSPDGNDVVFEVNGELWSAARKDGSVRRLLPRKEDGGAEGSRRFYFDPGFLPSGDLLFAADADGGGQTSSLWFSRAPAAPGGSWGPPERVTADAPTAVRQISVSRGGKIAYVALSSTSNLWSLPLDPKSSLPSGSPVPLTLVASGRAMQPAFSPDGRKIAFILRRAGSALNLWVVDAGGGEPRPISTVAARRPDWLPDGSRIAFVARQGKRGIWTVALEGRTESLLFPLQDDMAWTALSPDGKLLAFHRESSGAGFSTWVAPIDGGPARRVTPPDVSAAYPRWSPDGRTLALEVHRAPDWILGTVPGTGGPFTVLVDEKGQSWPYDFSPDGERISFAGLRDGIWNVFWVARKDRAVRRLTDNRQRRTFIRYPAWSPRGDQIVYERSETTGNIWLLEPK